MPLILTIEQVSIIRNIVKNAGANYYDIEVELTDHICNMVEQLMHANKDISFLEALEKSLKVFEPQGLHRLINYRIKQNKEILTERTFMQTFFEAFKLPHLLMTVGVIIFYTYFYFNYRIHAEVIKAMFGTIAALTIVANFTVCIIYYIKSKKLKHKFSTLSNKIYIKLLLLPTMIALQIFNGRYRYTPEIENLGIKDNYTFYYIAIAITQSLLIIYTISVVATYYKQIKKIHSKFPYAFK